MTTKRKISVKDELSSVFKGVIPVEPESVLPQNEETEIVEQKTADTRINAAVAPLKTKLAKAKVRTKAKPQKTVKKIAAASSSSKATRAHDEEKDPKRAFTFQMPESLHARIAYYVENHAVGRGNSIAKVLIKGAEMLMTDLEKKSGIVK